MSTAVYRVEPYEPGPQGDDEHGLFDGCPLAVARSVTVAMLIVILVRSIYVATIMAFVDANAAKPPTDVGRCPKCGRSYWDCACVED